MSCCPTDGPGLKSILGLYRPAAWLSSLSLFALTFYHFPPPSVCFSSVFTPTVNYLLHLCLPLLSCALSHSLLHLLLLFSALIYGPTQPSSSLSLASHRFDTQITLPALMLCVSLYHCLPPSSPFVESNCFTLSPCFTFRQLMENKITTIERGAFQDLKELERLWVTLPHWRFLCLYTFHFKNSCVQTQNVQTKGKHQASKSWAINKLLHYISACSPAGGWTLPFV